MAIVPITLENLATTAQTNVPFSFGQVFAQGDLPFGSFVCLTAPGGATIPCQMDVKRRHRDGSIRHASLSVVIPSMPASSSLTYGITIAGSGPSGTAAVPSDFPGLSAVMTLTDYGAAVTGPNAGTVYTANAASRLANGTYTTWRSGPICSEWIVRVPLVTAGGVEHPDLHVRFEILAYKGLGKARVHCIVENTWAKPKNPQPTAQGSTPWETVSVAAVVYSYSLSIGGVVVDTRSINGHHRAKLTANSAGTYNGNKTGILADATVYTATVTIDGVAKPISLVGNDIQTYGQLYAAITAQLGGMGVCVIDDNNGGLRINSNTKGANSKVVITDGTLLPALKKSGDLRPIAGNEFIHYAGCRWKKTFWWGSEPAVHIRHDKTYLCASRAVPNYDPTLTGDAATIEKRALEIEAKGDIGGAGMQKPNMPGPGGSPGIAILPEWVAMYIVNQGKRAKDSMLKMADLMGSWPCHKREYDTDGPVSITKWPYATLSPNSGDSQNPATKLNEKLPSYVSNAALPSSGMVPDVSHHPDFNFVPYLVTADNCYLDGLLFYFTFTCINLNAARSYRDGGKCLWRAESQMRGKAWSLRTAVHTAYLVPDGHPKLAEVEYILGQNVQLFNTSYVDPAAPNHNMFGTFIEGIIYSDLLRVPDVGSSNFQEEFITQATGRAVELGFTELLPLLNYRSRHVAGRLTSGTEFCWQNAAEYVLVYRDTKTSPLYTSWGQVYQRSMKPAILAATCGSPEMGAAVGYGLNSMGGYPDGTEGYPANMQPAVAYCASFNMPKCDDAWTVFEGRTIKANYNKGPQFAIVPREIAVDPIRVQLYKAGANGLGGAISTTISDASFFDRVEGAQRQAGLVEYRIDYVRNDHPTQTIYDAVFYLSANTPSPDTTIDVGISPVGKNGVAPVLASEATAPAGVTFSNASSSATAISLGTLAPGDFIAVCYRRTVAAGTTEIKGDTFTRTIEGKIE